MELNTKMKVIIFIGLLASVAIAKDKATTAASTTEKYSSSTIAEENSTVANSICEDNSTYCDNSTEVPFSNFTTISSKNETVKKEIASAGQSVHGDFCTCDLQENFCDINCCCDKDCSLENKEVFQYCLSEPRFYDTRYCDYMKYIYINNTPVKWHINQNGLFCIIKSNHPPSYIIQRKHPIRTFVETRTEKVNKFSWRKELINENDIFNSSKKILYGSSMWLVNRRGIHKFGLLNSFITNRCLIKEAVFYLKNLDTKCSQNEIFEDNPYINLKYYFQNVYLITNPMLVNLTKWKQKVFENCPRNVCISIVPKICENYLTNCEDIKNDTKILTVRCNVSLITKMNTCYNVVKKLRYNIFHNGTKGAVHVELLAVLNNITHEFGGESSEFDQEFSVRFFWTNSTGDVKDLSGNPGYLINKPIFTGKLLTIKNGSDTLLKIKRNLTDAKESFLTIPDNIDGNCVLNETLFTRIEFGYNLITKCKYRSISFSTRKGVNGTEMCRALQRSVLEMWNFNNTMIGFFGNADENNLDDWIKALYKKDLDSLLNSTLGYFSSKMGYLSCLNLVSDLEIDIFHSRIDINDLLDQEKILAVTFSFGGFTNRTLIFNKNTSSVNYETSLKTTVTFYDLTTQKRKKAVDPPSLEIKLPYDFFYPFVRINNDCSNIRLNVLIFILTLVIVVHFK
ncbi:tectonic-3 [Diabrotica virgifera virgifera]|uniref:Tectonic-3-like n=1 Tax=Diabrotica virgifera virgifera TaxID=50390 RepID=A0ABM5IHD3_DIAVI|nr:tectonic-3 [Diabrotica virgifera virgifera]